jgi:hypothetical protein
MDIADQFAKYYYETFEALIQGKPEEKVQKKDMLALLYVRFLVLRNQQSH